MRATIRTRAQFEGIIDPQWRSPDEEERRRRVLGRVEDATRALEPLTTEHLHAGVHMSDGTLTLIDPRDAQWSGLTCGTAQIDARLRDEVTVAHAGLRALYELRRGDEVIAVLTMQAGAQHLAPSQVNGSASASSLPTLSIPVIAVHRTHQGQGIGQRLIDIVICLALARAPDYGIKTLSLESTPDSDGFFTTAGFERDDGAAHGGGRARWLRLQ